MKLKHFWWILRRKIAFAILPKADRCVYQEFDRAFVNQALIELSEFRERNKKREA